MKEGCVSRTEKAGRSVELPVLASPGPVAPEPGIAKSRTARWRAISLILLYLLMIAHIIQWRITGTTVSPIEPSESMFTLQNGAINAGFIFFTLAILTTLIFGRFVCGWGCHIVALQDFCAWLLKKVGMTPRPFRSRLLVYVPLIVALYMFVWPTVGRYFVKPPNEPLFPNFTNHLITTDFWATFPPVWVAIPFLFVCGFVTVYFLGSKGFCTYGCPYGGFFAVADRFAPGKIRVTDACNQCGHCTAVCMSNVKVHAEVNTYGMVIDPGCMKHMDCISVCPNDALYFGFGKPSFGAGKNTGGTTTLGTITKNYSLTWPEEIAAAIIFFVSFMAVWDVYQLVAMLFALGIAIVTTFLAMKCWRLFRASDAAFYGTSLKSAGKITTAGFAFVAFSIGWIGVNAHSGYVRYHERAGKIAFETIRIPDELALARPNPARWLSTADRENITKGTNHFYDASRAGLFTNKEAISKLAWMEYLSGDNEQAVALLDRAARYQEGQDRTLSLYYRGAILNRLGRPEEALQNLDEAIRERPDLATAIEEKGEALWRLGRKEEAVAAWSDAVTKTAGLPLANNFLAGAAASTGRAQAAAAYEAQAARTTPNDPLFHWMLGMRLQNIGMNEAAEKQFERAIQLNPEFRRAR
jgi:tetratricopeptide (TPR) repeat protein/NAD-dependent dihydropyrimidine dehydrogenase PreA subunit